MLRATFVCAGMVLGMVVVPVMASAQDNSCTVVDNTGQCLIKAADPARPGGPAGPGTPGRVEKKGNGGATVPCVAIPINPPPPPGDPLWGGNDPSTGHIVAYSCFSPGADFQNGQANITPVFVPNGGAIPPPPPNPAELAQQAINQMTLLKPAIRMAPPPDSAGAVVGVPVWLWVERGESTTGPVTRSASAGGITVTATAKVGRVEWNMGDGRTVTCTSPGTPYDPSRAQQGSPDCGHVYQLRSLPARTGGAGKYTITATSVWQIHWEGGGQEGDQTLSLSSNAALAVGELQSVNQAGGN